MENGKHRLLSLVAVALALVLMLAAIPFVASAQGLAVNAYPMNITLLSGTFEGRYTGTLADGLPEGHGVFEETGELDQTTGQAIVEDSPVTWTYKGSFVGGVMEGEGSLSYSDGTKETGVFSSGELENPDGADMEAGENAVVFIGERTGDADPADGGAVYDTGEDIDVPSVVETDADVPEGEVVTFEGTAVIALTDWRAHAERVPDIISMVEDAVAENTAAVVVFNGDSEDAAKTMASWRTAHHETPFMTLVRQLTAFEGVSVVCGLGAHELAANAVRGTDSQQLADYLAALVECGNGKLHIVSTELQFAEGTPVRALYDAGIIERRAFVDGIYFLGVVDPTLMAYEYASSKTDMRYEWAFSSDERLDAAYGRASLYTEASIMDPRTTVAQAVFAYAADIGEAPCVLLAQCSGTAPDGISSLYEDMGLPANTVVVSGSGHHLPSTTFVGGAPLLCVEPPSHATGCAVLMSDASTGLWRMQGDRPYLGLYASRDGAWDKVAAAVNHTTGLKEEW